MISALYIIDVAELFFIDTTPFQDKYFTDPEDQVYDWRGIFPRRNYISNLLKVHLRQVQVKPTAFSKKKLDIYLFYCVLEEQ